MMLYSCLRVLNHSAAMPYSASHGLKIRSYLTGDTRWFVSAGFCALLF